MSDEFMNEKAVADRLGLSPSTLYRLRKKDEGPDCSKIGGRIVYRWADVVRYFEEHKPPRPPRNRAAK